MATQSMYIDKYTFIPEKNYAKIERVKVTRPLAKEEIFYQNQADKFEWLSLIFSLIGFCTAFLGGIIFGACEMWLPFCVCLICGILFGSFSFKFFGDKNYKYSELYSKFYNENNDRLWQECAEFMAVQEYNEEQREIAKSWRAEHPLEEKIRACLLDKNSSVDIAELARYYAEEYIKTKTN